MNMVNPSLCVTNCPEINGSGHGHVTYLSFPNNWQYLGHDTHYKVAMKSQQTFTICCMCVCHVLIKEFTYLLTYLLTDRKSYVDYRCRWFRVVVASLVSINKVNLRWARLVLGWVTVSGFDFWRRHFTSVCNQPPRLTQPSTVRGR